MGSNLVFDGKGGKYCGVPETRRTPRATASRNADALYRSRGCCFAIAMFIVGSLKALGMPLWF
jgi:hypothetical protein